MSNLSFFAELQRRHVYKVGAMYAVAGWLLVQIATQVFPFFEISNVAVRWVVLAVVAGFPVALVLAWLFDFTPQGIVRTETMGDWSAAPAALRQRRGMERKLNYLLGVLVLLGLGYFTAQRVGWLGPVAASTPANSDKSDGMRVVGRTSSFQFKGKDEDLREASGESLFTAEVFVSAAAGESTASLGKRLQTIDRSQSIYKFWSLDDAVAAALSGDRAEANRQAAALDARPAGPALLATVTADCLCGPPFDLDATPNFKARLAESGLHWPPAAAIQFPPRLPVAAP